LVSRSRLGALLLGALAAATCRGASEPAREERPRSIVLVTIDTLRADHVTREVAPNLARLAEEGLRFEQAVTVSPVTLPSHASLLTALYPPRHGVRDNAIFALTPEVPNLVPLLKDAGYATGAFVSAVVLDSRFGLDRGFDVYDDEVGDAERAASETLARARQWIGAAQSPFFAWIHLFEPHAPYKTGSYAQEVSLADRELGAFFAFLRDRGLWTDVVVSVTSDHGEALGDHGEQTHGFFVYDATVRIPWIVRAPGVAPITLREQVRIVDVLPTLVDLAAAGVKWDAARVDGVSVVAAVREGQMPRLEAFVETWLPRHQFGWSELQGLRVDGQKLIEATSVSDRRAGRELYDLAADPGEQASVIEAHAGSAERLSRVLGSIRTAGAASARMLPADSLMAERFMALGYIGAVGEEGAARGNLPLPREKLPVYLRVMDAMARASTGESKAALAEADAALALDGGIAQAHFLRGTLLGQERRFKEAAAALERTLELSPRYATARFKLALAYLELGNARRAEAELTRVTADEPRNARAWHNLAALAYIQGDFPRAEERERRAIEIDPDYVEALNTLGAIHIVRREYDRAIDALHRATVLQPANAQVLANLALALRPAGRAAEADAAASKACTIDKRYCERRTP
jgi:choline-sulfatase